MNVFIGMDSRQPVAGMVLISSIIRHQSAPISIIPLLYEQLPISRKGLTGFTFARYLVPALMGYQGRAVFMDADMIVLDDIHELFRQDDGSAVQVVKSSQRFEWPSLMVFNCEQCEKLTLEYVDDPKSMPQSLEWAPSVGELPHYWNFIVGYDEPYASEEKPSLIHYTRGIPIFSECRGEDYADLWLEEYQQMCSTVSWIELMGTSVHKEGILKDMAQLQGNYIPH